MILHGRKIVIKKGDGTAIAACKSCDIDISCDTIETASRTSSEFREFIKGRTTWSVTMSYLVTSLKQANLLGQTLTLLISNSDDPTDKLTGKAICTKCKITATTGSLVQGSFAFQGSGDLI